MEYSVLPLRNTVLFPNQIIPIYIGRKASLDLVKDVDDSKNKDIIVVAQKDGNVESPVNDDLYQTGTLATVMKIFDMLNRIDFCLIFPTIYSQIIIPYINSHHNFFISPGC